MKISELIMTLGEALRDVGDAEVCVCVGEGSAQLIGKTVTGRNVRLPNNARGNRVVLHGEEVE